MTIRFAESSEYTLVAALYRSCNYYGGLQADDIIVIAVDTDIIGALRICSENGEKVLRGMQIKPVRHRKGTGSAMLNFLASNMDMKGCYCLPYKHLVSFYASIGFKEIPIQQAPLFLTERLGKYLSSGSEIIIMQLV